MVRRSLAPRSGTSVLGCVRKKIISNKTAVWGTVLRRATVGSGLRATGSKGPTATGGLDGAAGLLVKCISVVYVVQCSA